MTTITTAIITAREPASTADYVESLFVGDLPTFIGTTYEDHVDAWHVVHAAVKRHVWAMAAIAASLARQCGARTDISGTATNVQRFCSDVGIQRQHFHYLAATYAAFAVEPCRTGITGLLDSPELTFKHFAVAARYCAADPVRAVVAAHDNGWGANELKRQLTTRTPPAGFSLPCAIDELRDAINKRIATWPPEFRHTAADAVHTIAEGLEVCILPGVAHIALPPEAQDDTPPPFMEPDPPAWVTDDAPPDFSDPIGGHDVE